MALTSANASSASGQYTAPSCFPSSTMNASRADQRSDVAIGEFVQMGVGLVLFHRERKGAVVFGRDHLLLVTLVEPRRAYHRVADAYRAHPAKAPTARPETLP